MKDQLISFETAKLAKEKEFNEPCWFYDERNANREFIHNLKDVQNYNLYGGQYSAPTQSLLQKWLREEHKLEVNAYSTTVGSYTFKIFYFTEVINIKHLNGRNVEDKYSKSEWFESYEEALEAGLQEALKLIK